MSLLPCIHVSCLYVCLIMCPHNVLGTFHVYVMRYVCVILHTCTYVSAYFSYCRKDHFEIAYAQLRCKVEPNFSDRSLVLHSEYLKKARHIAGFAESASITEVVTSTGDILAYDYLVVATGSVHNGPTTKAERVKEFFSGNVNFEYM